MKLTKKNLKQLIRENFRDAADNAAADDESNDLDLRWSRFMGNYKNDQRIRKTTNSCLASNSSNETSELLADILEAIEDETVRDRFLMIIPQMVEDRLKENN